MTDEDRRGILTVTLVLNSLSFNLSIFLFIRFFVSLGALFYPPSLKMNYIVGKVQNIGKSDILLFFYSLETLT